MAKIGFLLFVSISALCMASLYFSVIVTGVDIDPDPHELSSFLIEKHAAYDDEISALSGDNLTALFNVSNSLDRPFVAVVVLTKSRTGWRSVNDTSLHSILIPSIERTITTVEQEIFRIEIIVGFDEGDEFWEESANQNHLSSGSNLPISFLSVPKPSPLSHRIPFGFQFFMKGRPHHIPFNEVCRAAYEYGADYIVRVNDDTEFKSNEWISKGVQRLWNYNPPNVGVIGPTCHEGNKEILTHDMVHRTHLDIFADYYPDQFDNWYIDDWISKVYGPARTTKLASWEVHHHIGKHGTRYRIRYSQQKLLSAMLERGRQRINDFLLLHNNQTSRDPNTNKVLGTNRVAFVSGPIENFHHNNSSKIHHWL